MLHLSDNPLERLQVAAKNAVLVHAAQFMDDAPWLLQDEQKAAAVLSILAESGINAESGSPQCPQGVRSHPFEFRALLQEQETLEQRSRFALEKLR